VLTARVNACTIFYDHPLPRFRSNHKLFLTDGAGLALINFLLVLLLWPPFAEYSTSRAQPLVPGARSRSLGPAETLFLFRAARVFIDGPSRTAKSEVSETDLALRVSRERTGKAHSKDRAWRPPICETPDWGEMFF